MKSKMIMYVRIKLIIRRYVIFIYKVLARDGPIWYYKISPTA